MPATIIEINKTKFKKVTVDPVTLDIIENALRNARVEMDASLFRTAMSPGIREQGDAFPLIADHKGRMVVGQFGSFIDGFLNVYEGNIEDGDVIWLSDPYTCEGAVSHANDWLILLPVFRDGRLIAWTAMFGHMTDIGGKVPGSLPTDAVSIFEEGMRSSRSLAQPVVVSARSSVPPSCLSLVFGSSQRFRSPSVNPLQCSVFSTSSVSMLAQSLRPQTPYGILSSVAEEEPLCRPLQ